MKNVPSYDLLNRYQHDLTSQKIQFNPHQQQVIDTLDKLGKSLIQRENSWVYRLQRGVYPFFKRRLAFIEGVYLWGEVGRGKTYLLDLFYESLPIERKRRVHFHRFMQSIHQQLNTLKGQANPLTIIAHQIAHQAAVLCFDEFFVVDIADAMILSGLLQALFDEGVTLILTSNVMPENLYANGLQRERFLPAIEALKRHTKVILLKGEQDYRLTFLEQVKMYHFPLNEKTQQTINEVFTHLASSASVSHEPLLVEDRLIPTVAYGETVAWFLFRVLCKSYRSAIDYIEIARCFETVIVSDVERIQEAEEDVARRFIAMIDEFYERKVKLILCANVPIVDLYNGKILHFEFQRAQSRLFEMQSQAYLSQSHLP